ncbi:MAG: SpoIIE family protein phosphatase [Bacteroidales bacterium]|nr:SpoIIE family protein phosphatase [Bacteroidales bacterium]
MKNAAIDLSQISIETENIPLSGKWEFYDSELYTPTDFNNNKIKKPTYLEVPCLWNKSLDRGAKGYGTYRLKIKSLKKGELYAINIIRIQSSYKIWINSVLFHTNGVVGKTKKTSSAKWSSDDIIFKANQETAEIVIQVSNFYHKKGGIENPLIFGRAENITEYSWSISAMTIFLLGVLLIMASYHLAMFFFRKNDKSNLFFALTLIFSALFILGDGEILITKIYPEFSWEVLLKIIHSANYLRVLFFVLFIYVSFKEFLNKYVINAVTIIVVAIQILIIVTPAAIYSHVLIGFFIITAFVLIYLIIGQIKALAAKKAGALFSFLGIFILMLTVINDILKEYQIIQTISLSTFGVFIFIIFHSYLISIQNSKAFQFIKTLTEKLLVQGKIKDAFFSAKSYNLKAPLKAISEAVGADRALIFISQKNEWVATNEYIKTEETVKSMKVKMFSEKENVYFSAISVKKAISSKSPVYTLGTGNLKAKEIVYFEEAGIKSVFVYPFEKDSDVPALLYFENYNIIPGFVEKSNEILQAIMPQVLIFMDNYTSYNKLKKFNKSLEEKVQEVTKEIMLRNVELKNIREKIELQNDQTQKIKENLEKQNQEINDGIQYAGKIQYAFLPKEQEIKDVFPDSFVFLKLRDNIGGDFFWFKKINDTESVFVVADSTGHGVSGALMSIIGHELLNDAVLYKKIKSPKQILNAVQTGFSERISKEEEVGGIDLAVISYNSAKNEIVFSGAQNSIYFVHENSLAEIKGSPVSIGNSNFSETKNGNRYYTNRRISVKKGDVIYLFTDGFIDQVGALSGKKFMKKQFRNLLMSVHKESPDVQKRTLEKTLDAWKSEETQTDDILIAGIIF